MSIINDVIFLTVKLRTPTDIQRRFIDRLNQVQLKQTNKRTVQNGCDLNEIFMRTGCACLWLFMFGCAFENVNNSIK